MNENDKNKTLRTRPLLDSEKLSVLLVASDDRLVRSIHRAVSGLLLVTHCPSIGCAGDYLATQHFDILAVVYEGQDTCVDALYTKVRAHLPSMSRALLTWDSDIHRPFDCNIILTPQWPDELVVELRGCTE